MSIQSSAEAIGRHKYPAATFGLVGAGAITLCADVLSRKVIDRPIPNTVSLLPTDIQNSTSTLAVVLPGYNNLNGIEMSIGLQKAIGEKAVVAYTSYQKSGLGLDEIARDLQQVVNNSEYQKIIYYGHSMGGVASSHLGPIIKGDHSSDLWLDCSPFCLNDIKAPKWLVKLSLLLPYNGGLLSKAAAMEAADLLEHFKRSNEHVHRKLKDTLSFVNNGPTYELNRAQLRAIANNGKSSDTFDNVYYLRPENAADDTVVDVESAFLNWQSVFPQINQVLVAGGKHASIKDTFEEYRKAIKINDLLGKTVLGCTDVNPIELAA